MPYILESARKKWMEVRKEDAPDTVGELNYCITIMIKAYLEAQGTSYKTMNDIVGALESAKLEFYRRVVVPYENTKCEENGDVF